MQLSLLKKKQTTKKTQNNLKNEITYHMNYNFISFSTIASKFNSHLKAGKEKKWKTNHVLSLLLSYNILHHLHYFERRRKVFRYIFVNFRILYLICFPRNFMIKTQGKSCSTAVPSQRIT